MKRKSCCSLAKSVRSTPSQHENRVGVAGPFAAAYEIRAVEKSGLKDRTIARRKGIGQARLGVDPPPAWRGEAAGHVPMI
jgi:hypothetical protein